MMLSWFNRFMASALTTLLFAVVVLFAASQTFLDGQYIKTQLKDQNAYSRLSMAISSDIAKNAGDISVPQSQVTAQLQKIITPQILQQRLTKTIDEFQAYYQGKGPVPTLDVSDLVDKAQAAGLPAPDDPKLQAPIKLTAATKAKHLTNAAKAIGVGVLALILLLIAGIFVIARKRHNYKTFTAVLTSLGIMLSVTGAALLIVPHIFNKLYTFNPATNPFGSLAHDVALSILHDFALHLLVPGLAILAVGILIRVLIGKAAKRAKAASPSAEPGSTPTTSPPRPLTVATPPTDAPEAEPAPAPPMPRVNRPKPPRKIQL